MKRRKLTKAQKARLFLSYDGRCAHCDTRLSVHQVEWDHIKERRMAADEADAEACEELANFQPLCTDCHKAKTKKWKGIHAKAERQAGRSGQQARRKAGKTRTIPSRVDPWPPKGSRKLQSGSTFS